MNYSALYDEVNVTIKSTKKAKKATKTSVTRFELKDMVCNDEFTSNYSGIDIRISDLEKKNYVGNLLITGRNLHTMAIRGARSYKKALEYSMEKWDIETLEPKKSGETVEDVIEYV